jgi:hypothetical protein
MQTSQSWSLALEEQEQRQRKEYNISKDDAATQKVSFPTF